jgi:hypothetical protein
VSTGVSGAQSTPAHGSFAHRSPVAAQPFAQVFVVAGYEQLEPLAPATHVPLDA